MESPLYLGLLGYIALVSTTILILLAVLIASINSEIKSGISMASQLPGKLTPSDPFGKKPNPPKKPDAHQPSPQGDSDSDSSA